MRRKLFAFVSLLICTFLGIQPAYSLSRDSLPIIADGIVYDNNDIIITAHKLEYESTRVAVIFTIANNRPTDLYYSIENVQINGIQMSIGASGLFFGTVYAFMEADFSVGFWNCEINHAGIEHITDINIAFALKEDSDHTIIIDQTEIHLTTSDTGKYKQTYDFAGEEIYNQDGIRVIARINNNDDTYPCYSIVIIVENKSDKAVKVGFRDVAINQKMTGVSFVSSDWMRPGITVSGLSRMNTNISGFGLSSNKEISTVAFKLSIIPSRGNGGFSLGDEIVTEMIRIKN